MYNKKPNQYNLFKIKVMDSLSNLLSTGFIFMCVRALLFTYTNNSFPIYGYSQFTNLTN